MLVAEGPTAVFRRAGASSADAQRIGQTMIHGERLFDANIMQPVVAEVVLIGDSSTHVDQECDFHQPLIFEFQFGVGIEIWVAEAAFGWLGRVTDCG